MSDTPERETTSEAAPATEPPARSRVPAMLAGMTAGLLGLGALLFFHARGATNDVALASRPKGVTVVAARAGTYRPVRRYVGTIEPWQAAKIGPQLVSAYVETVLVRPGAAVKRGQVLATLDCRNASALEQSISMQARALEATQAAVSREAARVSELLDGGYASANEVEIKQAESSSKQAQLAALQAQLAGTQLQVSDCVLRAPFDGEIADRQADPGAFVRPGSAITTLVDRSTVRVTADVPEDDFAAVAPGTPVRLHALAVDRELTGAIARRAPAADALTRTIHVEVDLANDDRSLPVGSTAEVTLEVGEPAPAVEVPLAAAVVKGRRANLFAVDGAVARAVAVKVLGERGGSLFVDPSLGDGRRVVLEGRTALADGDAVAAVAKDGARPAAAPPPAGPSQAGIIQKVSAHPVGTP